MQYNDKIMQECQIVFIIGSAFYKQLETHLYRVNFKPLGVKTLGVTSALNETPRIGAPDNILRY